MSRDSELIVDRSKGNELAAVQTLPPEMMLLKMENESIMSVARVHPREPMKIVSQLQQLIDAWPAAAGDAIYVKPVGSVYQVKCANPRCGIVYETSALNNDTVCTACASPAKEPNPKKVQKFAEGLSIRAAEAIRSIFGYTRLALTIEVLPDETVKITGILVDYAAGNVTSDERIVSPWYKARGGGMQKTPVDRFMNVVVKSEKAKLRRDLILDNTPGVIKAMYRDMCESKLKGLVAAEVAEQKILPFLAELGVTQELAEAIVGRPLSLGWREEDRLTLRKISQGLRDGEVSVAELRETYLDEKQESDGKTSPPPSAGEVTAEALTSGSNKPAPAAKGKKKGAAAEAVPEDPHAALKSAYAKSLAGKTADEARAYFRERTLALEESGSYSSDELVSIVDVLADMTDAHCRK